MAQFPELFLSWGADEDGEPIEYRCRVTMDVAMHIEQRVALQELANRVVRNPEGIPISHVAWVMYCLLSGAGAPCSSADVWAAMRQQTLHESSVAATLQYVIQEVYGVGPERTPKKTKPAPKKKAARKKVPASARRR